jgi:hypothetical protein
VISTFSPFSWGRCGLYIDAAIIDVDYDIHIIAHLSRVPGDLPLLIGAIDIVVRILKDPHEFMDLGQPVGVDQVLAALDAIQEILRVLRRPLGYDASILLSAPEGY